MISALMRIRLKQLFRELIGIGLFRFLFLLGVIAYTFFMLFVASSTLNNAVEPVVFFLIVIAWIQLSRKDKLFLKSHSHSFRILFFVEYLILSLPLLFCLLFHLHWHLALIYVLLLGVIIQLNIALRSHSNTSKFQQWIPAYSFEWKGGIRKVLIFIVPMWCLALFSSFFIASVPVALFILGVIPLSFYERGEPVQMLLAPELASKKFIWHKIKTQFILFSILSLPLVVAFIIFHPEIWYIPLAEFVIFSILHAFLIVTKYAYYTPNEKSPAAQTYGAIGFVSMLVPVFLPVILFLFFLFYKNSQENLNFYLDDFN